jgi:hypothetical protein
MPKIYVGEKTVTSTKGTEKMDYLPIENWNYNPVSHPVLKSISNGSKTFNKRSEVLKLLQENSG